MLGGGRPRLKPDAEPQSLESHLWESPAVLATGDAKRRLHDGEIVTVDGTAGLVRIHAAGRASDDELLPAPAVVRAEGE